MRTTTALTLAALAAFGSAADQPTIPLYLYGKQVPLVYGGDVEASIISAAPSATAFVINCASNVENCGIPNKATITQGPSTYNGRLRIDLTIGPTTILGSVSNHCKIDSESAFCTTTFSGKYGTLSGSSVSTASEAIDVVSSATAIVTAGAAKLAKASSQAAKTSSSSDVAGPARTAAPLLVVGAGMAAALAL